MTRYLIILLLAGCTTTFVHPTKTNAEYQRDIYECERDAAPAQEPGRVRHLVISCMGVKGWRVQGMFE